MESSTIKSGGVGGAGHAKPWGDKEGSEQDREALKRIIVAKLQTAGTAGDFCSKMKFLCLVYPGVDEALAETIDSKFYDAYKKWKRVKFHESPTAQLQPLRRPSKPHRAAPRNPRCAAPQNPWGQILRPKFSSFGGF